MGISRLAVQVSVFFLLFCPSDLLPAGQAPVFIPVRKLIGVDTLKDAHTRTGFHGIVYELVFSDKFNKPGESPGPVRFYLPFIAQAYLLAADDPYWKAVHLWYGATTHLEWYDHQQITTRDGALVITMDSTATTQASLTPGMLTRLFQTIRSLGSTAPFTTDRCERQ